MLKRIHRCKKDQKKFRNFLSFSKEPKSCGFQSFENKRGVSEMIAYVILISIALGLAVSVFAWVKVVGTGAVTPPVDCKEGTSAILEDYNCDNRDLTLNIKNNGMFNVDGVIVKVSDNLSREAVEMLLPDYGGTSGIAGAPTAGHFSFSIIENGVASGLKPGAETIAKFSAMKSQYENYDSEYIRKITIQPFIRDKRKIACMGSVITEQLDNCRIAEGSVEPPPSEFNPDSLPGFVSWWKFDKDSSLDENDLNAVDSKSSNNALINGLKRQNNGEPVLNLGSSGQFDNTYLAWPFVIFSNGEYKMWYQGYKDKWQIGYATSSDAINWVKQNKNNGNDPVLPVGLLGKFDSDHVSAPTIIFNNGEYKMWYQGLKNGANWQIGYATSNDGITWTKQNNGEAVLVGDSGKFDSNGVYSPSVYYDGSTYHMWYSGYDGARLRVGYATSTNGINWDKYSGNPVLTGTSGKFDSNAVNSYIYGNNVVFYDNVYYMWYGGWDGKNYRIGYATSTNKVTWIKQNNGDPILNLSGNSGKFDSDYIFGSSSIYSGSDVKMWYTGYSTNSLKYRIGYAKTDPYVDGKRGKAISLDGNGNYVYVKDDNSLNLNDFTISTWVNVPSGITGVRPIVSKDNSTSWYILRLEDGVPKFYFTKTGNSNQLANCGENIMGRGWYLISAVRSGTNIKCYLNGLLREEKNNEVNFGKISPNNPLLIGKQSGFVTTTFNGQIDEVMIFNRALSGDEIGKIYKYYTT